MSILDPQKDVEEVIEKAITQERAAIDEAIDRAKAALDELLTKAIAQLGEYEVVISLRKKQPK